MTSSAADAKHFRNYLILKPTEIICIHYYMIANKHGQYNNASSQAASETEYQMQSRLFLNIVIRKGTTIFQLLACED